jgi:hypothetical protein
MGEYRTSSQWSDVVTRLNKVYISRLSSIHYTSDDRKMFRCTGIGSECVHLDLRENNLKHVTLLECQSEKCKSSMQTIVELSHENVAYTTLSIARNLTEKLLALYYHCL